MVLQFSQSIYSESVIFKTIYWFSNNYNITVDKNSSHFILNISNIPGTLTDLEKSKLELEINSKLIDYKTREIILNETKTIRDLTILKAFFHFDEMDENELKTLF